MEKTILLAALTSLRIANREAASVLAQLGGDAFVDLERMKDANETADNNITALQNLMFPPPARIPDFQTQG